MTVIPGVWAGHLCLFLQMQKSMSWALIPFVVYLEYRVGPVSVILESNLVRRGCMKIPLGLLLPGGYKPYS